MIFIHKADAFDLGAALDDLGGAFELQVLDQDDGIAIGEHIAIGIFDYAGTGGFRGFSHGFTGPFMTASNTFPAICMGQDFGHFTHGTGGFGHKGSVYQKCGTKFNDALS